MLKLSSKAVVFVADAVHGLPKAAKHARAVWSEQQGRDYLTPEAERVALLALQNAEKRFQRELEHGFLGEDEQADIMNDLAFIGAVKADLQRDLATAA
jgi:hypothetical protein